MTNWILETRKQAAQAGRSKYWTGKVCNRGHESQRYTATGVCCKCNSENAMIWEKNNYSTNDPKWVRISELIPVDQVEALRNYAKILREG